MSGVCFLGLDFSTQQLKALLIDDHLKVVYEDAVKFDTELPEYGTNGGVHLNVEAKTATSPTLMWVKALDLLLNRLKKSSIDVSKIAAISGSGQQHGSVYWKHGSEERLKTLDSSKSLHDNLSVPETCFRIDNSPIWMDSSTTEQCKRLEKAAGPPGMLPMYTGSSAYERFTGNQIAKINDNTPEAITETERISLVSSFAASLFLGKYAPIDFSDGSGMNLFDIILKEWWDICLDTSAPNLKPKLGEPVPSGTVVGKISKYFVEAFGFSPNCEIVAFTGDNPSSLAGMRLKPSEVIVSLGTSDTVFLWVKNHKWAFEGHVFVNPINEKEYMALLCYKNGSLQRERIRDACAGGSWEEFESLLQSTKMGNEGNIGIYFDVTEITPLNSHGRYRFNAKDEPVDSFDNATEVRALIEGQFLAKRLHAEQKNFQLSPQSRILATGGASESKAILQVIADVFNRSVYVLDVPNSASLGAAYRARHVSKEPSVSFDESTRNAPEFKLVASPTDGAAAVYDAMLERYKKLEAEHVKVDNFEQEVQGGSDSD